MPTETENVVLDCGHPVSRIEGSFAMSPFAIRGYAINNDGHKLCLSCCHAEEARRIHSGEKMTMYLTSEQVSSGVGDEMLTRYFIHNTLNTIRVELTNVEHIRSVATGKTRLHFKCMISGRRWYGNQIATANNVVVIKRYSR